jgi:hypothetical protein
VVVFASICSNDAFRFNHPIRLGISMSGGTEVGGATSERWQSVILDTVEGMSISLRSGYVVRRHTVADELTVSPAIHSTEKRNCVN